METRSGGVSEMSVGEGEGVAGIKGRFGKRGVWGRRRGEKSWFVEGIWNGARGK